MNRNWPISFILAGALIWSAPVRAGDAPRPGPSDDAGANPLAAHPLEQLTATRERPLFAPTRRPPPPPPAVASRVEQPPPPPPPPDVALFGIVIDVDGARALIRSSESDRIMGVRAGDEVGGWTVTQIEERQLVLSLGERSATFALFGSQGTSPAAPVIHHASRVLEVNSAGVLRARPVSKARP
jgi:hypothetical protein